MMEEYRVKHILLAEDEDYMRQAIVFILESAGYKVTAVDDGAVALQQLLGGAAEEEEYDMLITDLQMPRLLGNDLISMLTQKNIVMPVIVVSGYSDKQTMIELIRNGCNDFLEKPFTPESVLERVAEVSRKWFEARRWQEQKEHRLEAQVQDLRRLLEGYEKRFSTLLDEQRSKGEILVTTSVVAPLPAGDLKIQNQEQAALACAVASPEVTSACAGYAVAEEYQDGMWMVFAPQPTLCDENVAKLCQMIATHLDSGMRHFRFDLSRTADMGARVLATFAALATQLAAREEAHGLEISACSAEISQLFHLTELSHSYRLPESSKDV